MVSVALLGLYATLPWWMPKGALTRWLETDLGKTLGVAVRMDTLEASWAEGIVVRNVRVANAEGFGGGDMAVVESFKSDLSPIHLLWRGRFKWIELSGLRLRVVVHEDGRRNVEVLRPLIEMPPPERISVRGVTATIQLPNRDRPLRLDVADGQYDAGPGGLDRITLSAALVQKGSRAPVTLMASLDRGSGPIPMQSSLRFTGVDTSQLDLPAVLGLPLKRLSGLGEGQLDCRLDRAGTAEFSLTMSVSDLDVQPNKGPKLPVIEMAQIAVGGKADLVSNSLQADSFRLRLPGLDLTGKAVAQAPAMGGYWGDLRSLSLKGMVTPGTLAALLTGKPMLPGGIGIDGDVRVRLKFDEHFSQMPSGDRARAWSSEGMLDATAATVRIGRRVAKPAGRTLVAIFGGTVDEGTWQLNADRADLLIGQNTFRSRGSLGSVRRSFSRWAEAREPPTPATLMKELAELDWTGSWEIAELESLSDMLGGMLPKDVRLDGQIRGEWSFKPTGRMELRDVRLEPGTELRVGQWFVKPREKRMQLEASGVIDPDGSRLKRLRLWAGVGDAGLSVEEAVVSFSVVPAGAGEAIDVRGRGNWAVHDAGGLLACIPAAGQWRDRLGGELSGTCDFAFQPTRSRLHVVASATGLDVKLGEAFAKSAGDPTRVVLDLQADSSLPAAPRSRASLQVELGAASLDGYASFSPADGGREIRCGGRLRVSDAAWLLQRTPALARMLRGCDVRGSMVATASATLSGGDIAGEIVCDADDLQFRIPSVGGVKQRGSALRLRLAGGAAKGVATVSRFAADLGSTSVMGEGTVLLAEEAGAAPEGAFWPPPGVRGADLKVRGRLVLDSAARALLPPLARQADEIGLKGTAVVSGRILADAKTIDLAAKLDAARLDLDLPGKFRKPAGEPARASFELALPADLAHVRLRDLFVATGTGELRADAVWPILGKTPPALHLAVNVPDMARLAKASPAVAKYRPGGGAFVEARVRRRDGRDEIQHLTFTARDLTGRFIGPVGDEGVKGHPCRINGTVRLTDVSRPGGKLHIGGFATEGLELAIGSTHGFVVADVRSPLASPVGRIRLFSDNLDVHQLQRWPGAPESVVGGNLTAAEVKDLGDRADRVVRQIRSRLAKADLRVRVRVDRLRQFDARARAFYELRGLAADISIMNGQIYAGYRSGLNGGEMQFKYSLGLDEAAQRVKADSELSELLTGENMVAQLAMEFPRNKFYGTFSRSEEVTYALRDVVMSLLDERHSPVRTGTAVTVTTNGEVRGRAAPRFITGIFPGLNLASYRYRRMTAFADYLPDGTVENDMIFNGFNYDLYVTGTTDPNRIGRYGIGLILPGPPQTPEVHHRLRQGRIPIFKMKARIEGGQFHDEEITYPWPTETAYKIFLENNIVYRLWLAAQKKPPR